MARPTHTGHHLTMLHVLSLVLFALATHVHPFSWHSAYRRVPGSSSPPSPAAVRASAHHHRSSASDIRSRNPGAFWWRNRRRSLGPAAATVAEYLEGLPGGFRQHRQDGGWPLEGEEVVDQARGGVTFSAPLLSNHIPPMPEPGYHRQQQHHHHQHRLHHDHHRHHQPNFGDRRGSGWGFLIAPASTREDPHEHRQHAAATASAARARSTPHYVSFHYSTPVLRADSLNSMSRRDRLEDSLPSAAEREEREEITNAIDEAFGDDHSFRPSLKFGLFVPMKSSPLSPSSSSLSSSIAPSSSASSSVISGSANFNKALRPAVPGTKPSSASTSMPVQKEQSSLRIGVGESFGFPSKSSAAVRSSARLPSSSSSSSSNNKPHGGFQSISGSPATTGFSGDALGFGPMAEDSFSGFKPDYQTDRGNHEGTNGFGDAVDDVAAFGGSFSSSDPVHNNDVSPSFSEGGFGSEALPFGAGDLSFQAQPSGGFVSKESSGSGGGGVASAGSMAQPSSAFGGFMDGGAADTDVGMFGWAEPRGSPGTGGGFSAGIDPIPATSAGSSFVEDDKDCDTILTKSCASDSECVCYGFYYCSNGRCRDTTASSNAGAMTFGEKWHDGPAERLGLSGRR